MKKILTTALAIVLFVGASQAQTTDAKDHRQHGARQGQMFDQLNLTADQKEKLKSVRESERKEMQDLKKAGDVTPEQRKALHEKYRSQFDAILTPAQRDQMKKQREQWKEGGNKGFGKRGDMKKQGAFFSKELNLTADQQSKIQSIFQDFRTKAKDVQSNTSLTKEQKRDQMRSLTQQYMAQGKAILTPEQAKKFDEWKGKRKNRKAENV